MERRKILLGSGTAFATVLAGCASSTTDQETSSQSDDDSDERDNKIGSGKKNDNDKDHGEGKDNKKDIPGFDRDAFHIDNDVIRVKNVKYRQHKLNVSVMLTTSDRDELTEEVRTLVPRFTRAIQSADEFLAATEGIKFTLFDARKNRVFAFFLDVQWLREFLDGDITNDELVDRILDLIEQA